jgi:hypothetical protein
MKTFSLYLGDPDEPGTTDITSDQHYKPVVNAVLQIRDRLLLDPILRQPYLDLFTLVYEVKQHTPAQDQIPQIRHQPPTKIDVIDYLTNSFPDLYLISEEFGTKATQERISINAELI